MPYLPSKKFLRIAGALFAALLLVGGAYLVANLDSISGTPARLSLGSDPEETLVRAVAAKDTDGDGLRDWEESLYGTSPTNPDTDGDGTSDAEEIAANRNPLVAGPDDKDSSFNAEVGAAGESSRFADNLTETVSRELASTYFNLRQEGGLESAQSQEAFIEDLITAATKRPTVVPHIFAELTLSGEDAADARAYGNGVMEIVGGRYAVTYVDAYQILSDALAKGEDADRQKLSALAKAYENAGRDLLVLPVPRSLGDTHLAITNDFLLIAATLPEMGEPLTDPIKAIAAFKNYQDVLGELTTLFTKTARYFETSDILFSSEEKGKLWESFLKS